MTKKLDPNAPRKPGGVTGHALFRRRQDQMAREFSRRGPDKPKEPLPHSGGGAHTYDEDIERRFKQGHTVAQVAKEYTVTRQYLWSHYATAIRAMIKVRRIPDRAILGAPAAPLGRPRAARQKEG